MTEALHTFCCMGTNKKDHTHDSEIRRLKAYIAELEALNSGFQESQHRYECLFDRSLECIYVHDLKGNFMDANQAALDLIGITKAEIASLNIQSLLGQDQLALAAALREEIIHGGPGIHTAEFKLARRDGECLFIETRSAPLYKDGRAYAVLGVAKDVTKRKAFEEALQESEEKYRSLIENINDMIFRVDDQGVFTYASPASLRLFGLTPPEIIGRSLFDFMLPQDSRTFKDRQNGRKPEASLIEEFRILDKHRGVRWVRSSSRPIKNGGQTCGYQGVITDITQKKLLEQRLIPAERLASAGQLAASIAHEINSPLQAITITLATLSKSLASDKGLQENLELLRDAFISIRETVKNLLDLNRPGVEDKKPCSINTLIEKTVSLLGSQLKQTRVKVNLRLAQDLPHIMASGQQLGQVFLNLINNAIDAMAGEHSARDEYHHQSSGGTLTISTDLIDGTIVTAFSDTGPGITAEAFEHLFDPFFTQGKKTGMGIGLYLCRSIIEAHKGTICAQNAPKGGAVFMVHLPVEPIQGENHARF